MSSGAEKESSVVNQVSSGVLAGGFQRHSTAIWPLGRIVMDSTRSGAC